MRNALLLLFIAFSFVSCSNDNDEQDYVDCIENLSIENEFIYECNTYTTDSGRMNMNNSTGPKTGCMIELINSEHSDFDFEDGDSNINIINIWIKIPTAYYDLQELPEGTFELRDYNNDPNNLDIVTIFRVGPNVSVYDNEDYGSLLFSGMAMGQPENFEEATLTISKLNNGAYNIEYLFNADGKIVRGHYSGFLDFIDNWV